MFDVLSIYIESVVLQKGDCKVTLLSESNLWSLLETFCKTKLECKTTAIRVIPFRFAYVTSVVPDWSVKPVFPPIIPS